MVEQENVVAPPARTRKVKEPKKDGTVKKAAPTTRAGRAKVSKSAAKGEELLVQQQTHLAAIRNQLPKESIKSLGSRIRETTEDGRFVYEVLRDILLDGGQHASDRIAAAKVLLERGWGKVPDIVILEEIIRPENTLRNFSIEELRKSLVLLIHTEGPTPWALSIPLYIRNNRLSFF